MSREERRDLGEEVRRPIGHRMNPPSPSVIEVIPGIQTFTREAIFGAVWARPCLGLRERMLVTLAVLCALHRTPHLRTYVNSALNLGVDPLEIQEVFVQCSLDAGFPVTASALGIMEQVYKERGVEMAAQDVANVSLEELRNRGRARRIEMRGEEGGDGPSPAGPVDAWELEYGFGEIYQRPGLDGRTRLLCAIAAQSSRVGGERGPGFDPARGRERRALARRGGRSAAANGAVCRRSRGEAGSGRRRPCAGREVTWATNYSKATDSQT